jgi:hypothetical protein
MMSMEKQMKFQKLLRKTKHAKSIQRQQMAILLEALMLVLIDQVFRGRLSP